MDIDLTQQFSLSIFTEFRYQAIKITWLLPIFIDTDFYRFTTPGITPILVKYVVQYSDIAYPLDIQRVLNREFFASFIAKCVRTGSHKLVMYQKSN